MQDHAWFVSFAPADNPTIALAIIVENAGHGGVAAAPVSKAVMEVHFRKRGLLLEEPQDGSEDDKPELRAEQSVARRDKPQATSQIG